MSATFEWVSSKTTSVEEIGSLVGRLRSEHRLWGPDAPYRVVSRGDENLVIDVADEFIVRVNVQPTPHRAVAVATESRLLARLRPELDVAVPDFLVTDEVAGVVVYRKLPGQPYLLSTRRSSSELGSPALTDRLGTVLRTLRRLSDVVDLPHDDHPLELWLVETTSTANRIDPYLPADQRGQIWRFLATPPPANPVHRTLCHNDLGAEHLLVDPPSGELSGIIDWTDAALTDPARDLALIYRDLGPGAATAVARIAGIGEPSLLERTAFLARCKWIEDYAYGIDQPGRAQYLDNAHKTFRHTFVTG